MKLYHLAKTEAGQAIERYEARKKKPRYLHRSTKVVTLKNPRDNTERDILIGVTYRKPV